MFGAKWISSRSVSKKFWKYAINFHDGNLKSSKFYSTTNNLHNKNISSVKDLEIPMSYGKLAAKAWGSETGKPVLAFHGWLDNCGTFDKLIPLLNDKFFVVAIDAPGHGLSSHKPLGSLYTDLDAIRDYKKVVEYLGWKKLNLIGHSMGGCMALLFSSLFPNLIEKVVAIDQAKLFSEPQNAFPNVISQALDAILKLENKLSKPAPVYKKDAAALRLKEGMHHEVSLEAAEILLKRGSKPSECGQGVVFTRDLRCRPLEQLSLRDHELSYQYLTAIKCELMLIMANNTHAWYQNPHPSTVEEAFKIYRKNTKKFVLEHIDGNHFVHLNNPERVAPLINKFLSD